MTNFELWCEKNDRPAKRDSGEFSKSVKDYLFMLKALRELNPGSPKLYSISMSCHMDEYCQGVMDGRYQGAWLSSSGIDPQEDYR